MHGRPLHTRGWLQRQADGWLLQLFDIGDLLGELEQQDHRLTQQALAVALGRALRDCDEERLILTASEQLKHLAEHWHAGSLRLMLAGDCGWYTYTCSDNDWPWADDERLRPWLQTLPPRGREVAAGNSLLQPSCAGLPLLAVPYLHGHTVQAWLLCAGAQRPPASETVAALLQALIEPCSVACASTNCGNVHATWMNCNSNWGQAGGHGLCKGRCSSTRRWPCAWAYRLRPPPSNGWAGCTRPIVKPHAWRGNNCAQALL
ncbi:hypothetical protein QFA96_04930 [Pseudomonas sp. Ap32]|nr:hypothetical protein QFA96_04930 [Pseudomonas sp. Ap32]